LGGSVRARRVANCRRRRRGNVIAIGVGQQAIAQPVLNGFCRIARRNSRDQVRWLHADVEILADAGGEIGEARAALLRVRRIDHLDDLLLLDGLHEQHFLGQVSLQAHDLGADGC
jgi:hypothetical protein